MKPIYEVILVTILFFSVCFIYKGQQPISLENGKGWDGVAYYKITEQIHEGTLPIEGPAPFIKRFGNFILVSYYSEITGLDLMESALHVNLFGMFITVILLLFWFRIFIKSYWVRALLLLLFMTAWFAPLRISFYLPMSSDTWGALWFLVGLLLLNYIRKLHDNEKSIFWSVVIFSMIVAVGILFRESNAVLALAIFFILNPFEFFSPSSKTLTRSYLLNYMKKLWGFYFNKKFIVLFMPIVAVVIVNLAVSTFVIKIDESGSYNGYFWAIMTWLYTKSLPEFALGVFNAYGPIFLLTPFFYGLFKSFFIKRQELFFLLVISFFFGYIGGADTERILFMSGFPIVLVLIGFSIESVFKSEQRWWLYVLLLFQTIAYRFYWFLPDYPNLTDNKPLPLFSLIGEDFQYLYLYAQHGHVYLNAILFIEYIILFLATIYVLSYKITLKRSKYLKE